MQENSDLAETFQEMMDDLRGQIVTLQDRLSDLESELRRVADLAQSADYAASDAKRQADEAQRAGQRGW